MSSLSSEKNVSEKTQKMPRHILNNRLNELKIGDALIDPVYKLRILCEDKSGKIYRVWSGSHIVMERRKLELILNYLDGRVHMTLKINVGGARKKDSDEEELCGIYPSYDPGGNLRLSAIGILNKVFGFFSFTGNSIDWYRVVVQEKQSLWLDPV
jgi:hypothetical protein